jgi:type VI secretion system protein ImpM
VNVPVSHAPPGWFGKLPGLGDFAHRRLSAPFRESWDQWLNDGLAGLRQRHARQWIAHYLEGPVWCFALGAGTVDRQAWIGVLMPSVDGVGRYFPFTLAQPFEGALDAARWWTHAAAAALEALEGDLDAGRFEDLLGRRFGHGPSWGETLPPPPGCSSWQTEPAGEIGRHFAYTGLPRGAQFDALFGCTREGEWPTQEENPG